MKLLIIWDTALRVKNMFKNASLTLFLVAIHLCECKKKQYSLYGVHLYNVVTCIKGLFCPPLEPKTENCFSPISFDWIIRIITEV